MCHHPYDGRDREPTGPPPPSGTSPSAATDAVIDPGGFRSEEQRPVGHQNQLRDPISSDWLTRAALLPGRSLQVAMALWSISGVTGLRCIPLSNLDVGRWGLSRSSKYRGLACLEEAGLVAVKRKLGRAPMVTMLDPGP
jgi:hypothetical protein